VRGIGDRGDRPIESRSRRAVRVTALTLFALTFAWAAFLLLAGGFDTRLFGARVTTNEPLRPLLIASVLLTVFIMSGGVVRSTDRWIAAVRGIPPAAAALAVAILTALAGIAFATTAAGGADAYGYVSQAELWLRGSLRIEQPFASEVPWPGAQWTFAPLGYRPTEIPGDQAIVPTYSAGLPMIMAAAKLIGGQPALYAVVPIAGGLLVLATFGIGRRLASPGAGLIGACLVATSPAFLFMLVWPMTDVPVAAAWAVAMYFLLGVSRRSIVAAGLATSVAILIRPNLVFLGAWMGLWYLMRRKPRASSPEPRAAGAAARFADAAIFALSAAPGILATAAINNYLYGSPTQSGYIGLEGMFTAANVWPNVKLYLGWFVESQRVASLLGVVAIMLPWRRLWPAAPDRRVFGVIALFVASLWGFYFAYLVFESWWYLRFMLSSWPFIMVGLAALAMAVVRPERPVASAAAIGAVIVLGIVNLRTAIDRSAFELWQSERRYVSIGKLVGGSTEPNSVIFTMQHSGSVRYYGGRMTLRFDNLDSTWLDRAVNWLDAHGAPSYLLVEDWEEEGFRKQFAGSAALEHLGTPPVFVYEGPARARLYNLTRFRLRDDRVIQIVETYQRLRDVAPAPPPALTFTR
jgi:hypothetical protein